MRGDYVHYPLLLYASINCLLAVALRDYVFDAVWSDLVIYKGGDWMGLTVSFGFVAGSDSSYDFASPSKEIQWLASVFTGIIFCVIVSQVE